MPWHHTMTVFDYPDAGLGGHNYCRNPTGRESGPWCYTTDYPEVEWEECDVGQPEKCDASEPSLLSSAQTRADGLIPLKLREGADGHVKELEVVYYVASLPPSMQGVKVVLLPIQGDADLLLSFSEPRPTRSSATWLDESVGVKQFTLPASSEFFCGRKPSEDFDGRQLRNRRRAEEECKLHIGVSGFEEGDFKLFLYNYTGRGQRRRGRRHDGLRRLCGHFVLSGLRRPAPRQRRVRHRLQHDRVRVGRRRLRLRRRVRL
mmetsp:Transcript_32753/g.96862  ORF Transcript_32753/g.96862 Transcript_32753/m.96862 type:complete len:261 (-) Transcript_32753:525-1307(-)